MKQNEKIKPLRKNMKLAEARFSTETIPPAGNSASNSVGDSKRLKPLSRPRWLSEPVWPFQSSSIEVDGSKVAVTDVGRGPVLLFVHTGFWSIIWRDVI